MTLESVFFDRMSGFPDLHALVDDRIYRVRAPQGVIVPFLVHTRIDTVRYDAMASAAGVLSTRIQIDCFSNDDDQVREIAKQVFLALDTWIDPDSDPEIFGCSEFNDGTDEFDDNTELYRATVDVIVGHRD
jgi:uncharacterized protein DUF3168